MGFGDAIRSCLQKYATFAGRAPRSEFWWFWLFGGLVSAVCGVIDTAILGAPAGEGWLSALAGLALLLPSLAVSVRRLHDIGRSGWWWWIALIPIIGWIVLIVWYCQASQPGTNQFGPDPLGRQVVRPMAPAADLSAMTTPIPEVPKREGP